MDMPVPSMADKPDPALRTLKVELLSNGSFISCVPNAREPTPFETDFFKGQAMILVRTNPIDELYKSIFLGRLTDIYVLHCHFHHHLDIFIGNACLKFKSKGNSNASHWEKFMSEQRRQAKWNWDY